MKHWTNGHGSVALQYSRARKPIQVFCFRDRGTYQEAFEQEKARFLEALHLYDDVEASLVADTLKKPVSSS